MRLDPTVKQAIDLRASKDAIDQWFAQQVEAGYVVPDGGYRLGLRQEDVSLLTGAFVLAKEASALGIDPPPLVDADGQVHPLTMEALTLVMLGYGQYRAALSSEYAARLAAVAQEGQ